MGDAGECVVWDAEVVTIAIGILVATASLFGVFLHFTMNTMPTMIAKTTIVTITPITTGEVPEDDNNKQQQK